MSILVFIHVVFINSSLLVFCWVVFHYVGFSGDNSGKEPPANAGDIRDEGSIPGWGRSPGGGRGNPLQYSCLENLQGQRSLVGYSPWGCKESDATQATEHACTHVPLYEHTIIGLSSHFISGYLGSLQFLTVRNKTIKTICR